MVPDDKVGLNSILTNAMRNGGSEAYPENELNQLLEDKAARIEFGMGQNSGSASLNVLKEDFAELLPVLVDVMMNPLMPQEKIDLAIRQQKSGIRGAMTMHSRLVSECSANLFMAKIQFRAEPLNYTRSITSPRRPD